MQRNDIVCFIPLAGVVLLFEVPFAVAGLLASPSQSLAPIVVAFGVLGAVLLAAGPLGPPTYWFGVTRTPMNEKDRLEGRS
jgi:hypothetical protein